MSKGNHPTVRVGLVVAMVATFVAVIAPTAANATEPKNVNVTFEGCRGSVDSGSYIPNPDGPGFICSDDEYTTGNLGGGWAELDLVPHRLTVSLGTQAAATTTYDLRIDADHIDPKNDAPGYDFIQEPVINTELSDASCEIVTGPLVGIDPPEEDIYRDIEITQDKGTTCVFDYVERLALGSHLNSGASLHSHTKNETGGTQGVGNRDISIPIPEAFEAQSITKTMTATQDQQKAWTLSKEATPLELNLGDTCLPNNADPTGTVEVTITWTDEGNVPAGQVLVVTEVTANNPSHRDIQVDVEDVIFSGTTPLDTANASEIVAGGDSVVVLHHEVLIDAADAVNLNDVATAEYTDVEFPDVEIPGTTEATANATVVPSGTIVNGEVDITDSESITGTGLDFSVANPGVGTFTGYTPGTFVTGPVLWSLEDQTTSGSVTFTKTVRFDGPGDASGVLSDEANLSVGGTPIVDEVTASTSISSNSIATLTINKTTSVNVEADTTFDFTVTGPGGFSKPVSVTVLAGFNSGSNTLGGLDDGIYTVTETDTADYTEEAPKTVTIDAGECSDSVSFNNTLRQANILVDKITNPSGSLQSFDFTASYEADGFSLTDAAAPNDSGPLSPGNGYSVAEVTPNGWDLTSATCSDGSPITNISLQPGETVTCTFTNTKLGSITLVKETSPSPDATDTTFSFTRDFGSSPLGLKDGESDTVSNLAAGPYSASETVPAGWSLTSFECDNGDDASAITLGVGEDITCTAVNTLQTGNIVIVKQTDPTTATQKFEFDTSYDATNFFLGNTESDDSGPLSVLGSPYSAAEVNVPSGWILKSFTCDHGQSPAAITVIANDTVTCTAVNEQQGKARVVKTFNGGTPPAGSSYTFSLRTGASAGVPGQTLESLTFNDANGYDQTFQTFLIPGNSYQLCEENVPVGGHSDLSDLPGAFSPGQSPADNSTQCAPFTVTAGETKTFNVNNTPPPGGDTRTIGYWKNWASCSGSKGKQDPKLDQTLFAAGVNGISIGDLVLHGGATANNAGADCIKAVNILNKTTIDGKKKMASDPAFNLAAQLLAAKLNVVAGAGTCQAAADAIAQAQALLDAVNFDGTKAPTMTAAQKTQANTLASTLDKYNNGDLCP